MSDVVVTGRGVVTSLGETADGFFDALIGRRSGIADGTGACTEFDPETVMTPKEARRSDRVAHFALAAAQQAWEDAAPEGIDPERAAVVVGTGVGGLETMERNTSAFESAAGAGAAGRVAAFGTEDFRIV